MSKQNAKDAAVIRTQRYQQENVYRYTAVDGRCYDTERLPRPEDLKPHLTQQDFAVGCHQEKMNATALAHMAFREACNRGLNILASPEWEIVDPKPPGKPATYVRLA